MRAANDNHPIVTLRANGKPEPLAKLLVRVLVRRALISEGVIAGVDACRDQASAR